MRADWRTPSIYTTVHISPDRTNACSTRPRCLPFVTLSMFVVFLAFVIYSPYECTYTTHQTTQLSPPSCRAHALCANTLFDSTVAFSHRAILIWGIEAGSILDTQWSLPCRTLQGIPHFNILTTQWFDYFFIMLYGLVLKSWPIQLIVSYDRLVFYSPFWLTFATKQYSRDSVTKTGICVTY